MKSIVLYTTKTGNTEKLAKAISDALKTDCVNITDTTDFFKLNLNKYDHFFLGSGVYGGKPHKNIIKFLNQFDFQSQKIIVPFFTWLGRGKSDNDAFKAIKNILNNKNQIVNENYYKCYGKSFLFIRYSHPDKNDLEKAVQWANNMVQNAKQ